MPDQLRCIKISCVVLSHSPVKLHGKCAVALQLENT